MIEGEPAAVMPVSLPTVLAFWAVLVTGSIAGVIALWGAVYGRVKSLSRPASASKQDSQDARLDRIERALEAIAIEIERLGEGQRFTTKLLAERERVQQPTVRSPQSSIITPH